MLTDTELLAYNAAVVVVTTHFHVGTDFLTFKAKSIQAAIVDLPFGESFLFQILDELRMCTCKGESGGVHELFLVVK